jgi:hypothetical protein
LQLAAARLHQLFSQLHVRCTDARSDAVTDAVTDVVTDTCSHAEANSAADATADATSVACAHPRAVACANSRAVACAHPRAVARTDSRAWHHSAAWLFITIGTDLDGNAAVHVHVLVSNVGCSGDRYNRPRVARF